MKRVVLSFVFALLVLGCAHAPAPSSDEMARNTDRLEGTFPTLEQIQVRGFRSQDWCRFIDYPRGSFSNLLDSANACNLFTTPPKAFDPAALADYERVRKALADSGVSAFVVWNIDYDDAGQITGAEFDVTAGSFDRFSYHFSRDKAFSGDDYEAIVLQQINEHWWFLSEDFN